MKTLSNVSIGSSVIVKKVSGQGALKRRVLDMGITKGTEIYIRKSAPMGDPIQLHLRGFELTIRKRDAEMVEIE